MALYSIYAVGCDCQVTQMDVLCAMPCWISQWSWPINMFMFFNRPCRYLMQLCCLWLFFPRTCSCLMVEGFSGAGTIVTLASANSGDTGGSLVVNGYRAGSLIELTLQFIVEHT